jgi:hypothetical protein
VADGLSPILSQKPINHNHLYHPIQNPRTTQLRTPLLPEGIAPETTLLQSLHEIKTLTALGIVKKTKKPLQPILELSTQIRQTQIATPQ